MMIALYDLNVKMYVKPRGMVGIKGQIIYFEKKV